MHIIGGNLNGGAARGAYLLHRELLNQGIKSEIITDSEYHIKEDKYIWYIKKNLLQSDKALLNLYPKHLNQIFSSGLFGCDITKFEAYKEADIIHLHWINNNFLDLSCLTKISKPIIWTLRDMWSMTGGCHYSMDCTLFYTFCQNCPVLNSNHGHDLSSFIMQKKIECYSNNNIVFIGVSPWLSQETKKSFLLKQYQIKTIYNGVDPSVFYPVDKRDARVNIGVDTKKKIITVVSQKIDTFYKGFDLFTQAVNLLDASKYFICFVGNIDINNVRAQLANFEIKFFGYIDDDNILKNIYNASDVFVAPSKMEAFGKTLVESMFCATPVVCFDASGPAALVQHKITGYKACPFSVEDLAEGIEWVCFYANYKKLSKKTLEVSNDLFSIKKITEQYVNQYRDVLSNKAQVSKANIPAQMLLSYECDIEEVHGTSIKYWKKTTLNQLKKLSQKSQKYVIYGFGTYGKGIAEFLQKGSFTFVDQSSALISENIQEGEVYSPKNLYHIPYDRIIISALGREDEIEKYLVEILHVNKEKIIRLAL